MAFYKWKSKPIYYYRINMSETATNDSLEDFPPPSNQIYLESRRLRRRGGLLLLNGSEQLAEFKQ